VSAPVELGLTGWFGATDGTSYGATTGTAAVRSLRLQRTASWLRDVTATLRSSVGYRFRRRAANSDSQPGAAAAVFDVLPLERFVSKRGPSTGSIVGSIREWRSRTNASRASAAGYPGQSRRRSSGAMPQDDIVLPPNRLRAQSMRGKSASRTSGCSSWTATLPTVMNNTEAAPASTRVISRGHSVCNDVFRQELPIKTIDLLGHLP
jgi:hypothetical protein